MTTGTTPRKYVVGTKSASFNLSDTVPNIPSSAPQYHKIQATSKVCIEVEVTNASGLTSSLELKLRSHQESNGVKLGEENGGTASSIAISADGNYMFDFETAAAYVDPEITISAGSADFTIYISSKE